MRHITITIHRDKIRQRVVSVTQRTSRIESSDNLSQLGLLKQADDSVAAEMINDWIDEYAAKAKARCEAYLHRRDHNGMDNESRTENDIMIHLEMPDTWVNSTNDMEKSFNSYIINSCLSEWYEMSDANKASRYAAKAVDDYDNIHWCLCKRQPGTNKKPLRPF